MHITWRWKEQEWSYGLIGSAKGSKFLVSLQRLRVQSYSQLYKELERRTHACWREEEWSSNTLLIYLRWAGLSSGAKDATWFRLFKKTWTTRVKNSRSAYISSTFYLNSETLSSCARRPRSSLALSFRSARVPGRASNWEKIQSYQRTDSQRGSNTKPDHYRRSIDIARCRRIFFLFFSLPL